MTPTKAIDVLNAIARDEYARLAILAGKDSQISMIKAARSYQISQNPFPLFNGLANVDDLARFDQFQLSPVRTEHDFYGEHCEVTTICSAEIWSVYGHDGEEWQLVHDGLDEHDTGTALFQIVALTGKPIAFAATDYRLTARSLPSLAAVLTEKIHAEIPGYDDPEDFRDDDFDNHPLAAIREILTAALEKGV